MYSLLLANNYCLNITQTGPVDPACLRSLRDALWEVRADWFDLGVELEIKEGTLNVILIV